MKDGLTVLNLISYMLTWNGVPRQNSRVPVGSYPFCDFRAGWRCKEDKERGEGGKTRERKERGRGEEERKQERREGFRRRMVISPKEEHVRIASRFAKRLGEALKSASNRGHTDCSRSPSSTLNAVTPTSITEKIKEAHPGVKVAR
jgi:hypothetical protein